MSRFFGLLFARPSFLEGVARLLDLGNTLAEYNESQTPEQADFLALRSDWRAVGAEITVAADRGRHLIVAER
jgi:hypothetical protein